MFENEVDKSSESTTDKFSGEGQCESNEMSQNISDTSDNNGSTSDESSLDALKLKLKEAEEKVLRVAADFDNDKKRIQKRAEEMLKYANEQIITGLIPLIDDFDRALDSLEQGHELKTIQQGLSMVQTSFHKILIENGVEQIEAVNKPFDPNLHEAVAQVIDDKLEEDTVIEELQRGYTLHGRLARPSRVKVSKKS